MLGRSSELDRSAARVPAPGSPAAGKVSRGEWAVVCTVAVVLAVGTCGAVARWNVSVSDIAILEMKLSGVGDYWPVRGAYSRFGWDHPGPAHLYYLAAWYFTLGKTASALLIATAFWNGAMLLGAWWVSRLRSRSLGWLILLAGASLLAAGDHVNATLPWNPEVGKVAVLTLIVLAWDAALGGKWGAFGMLPLASFLVQSHVGYAPVAAALCAAAFVLLVVWSRRPESLDLRASRSSRGRWRRSTAWVGGLSVTAAMWILPVLADLADHRFNLVAPLLGGRGEPLGVDGSIPVVANSYSPGPWWVETQRIALPDQFSWPVLLAVPVAAAVVTVVGRVGRPAVAAVVVTWVAIAAAAASVSRIVGEPFVYLAVYLPAVCLASLAFGLWLLWGAARRADGRSREAGPALGAVCGALAVVMMLHLAVRMWTGPQLLPHMSEAVAGLSSQVESRWGEAPREVHLQPDPSLTDSGLVSGVALELVRRGFSVSLPAEMAVRGDPRMAAQSATATVLRVAELPAEVEPGTGAPDRVALHTGLASADREEVRRITESIERLEAQSAVASDGSELADQIAVARYLRAVTVDGRATYVIERAG